MHRILSPVLLCLIIATSAARTQTGSPPNYGEPLEYSIPLLTAVPPLDTTQPTDVVSAYLWADELMRTTQMVPINNWIGHLTYGDTMKFLAKMFYRVSDNNPISLYQWEISGNPNSLSQHLSWNYLGFPAQEVPMLANQIGWGLGDSTRTGFILVSDIIADVSVSDTFVVNATSSLPLVLVNSTIKDVIKGQKVPLCVGEDMLSRKKSNGYTTQSISTIWATYPVAADTGTCLQFEYSPQWQRGLFDDAPGPRTPLLSDSTGWWVRPSGEYIVFLRIAGIGSDTVNGYFSIEPYWGVFGSQGAIYRVIGGIVQDPNDDFGIGASIGLPVDVWKTRLRARIYNILNP